MKILDDDIFLVVLFMTNKLGCGVVIEIIFKLDIAFFRYFVTFSIILAVLLLIFYEVCLFASNYFYVRLAYLLTKIRTPVVFYGDYRSAFGRL